MSTPKRQNHRIHPCNHQRKNELIHFLIERNTGKKILIVTSNDNETLKNEFRGANITLLSDAALAEAPDLRCEVLISYDLPEKAILYMSRFARASEYALITLDAEDQKRLYPIELLNGRTIVQEVVKGFEPDFGIAADNEQKAIINAERAARKEKFAAQSEKRDTRNKRDGKRSDTNRDERKDTRPPRNTDDGFSAKKQQSSKPRFIGKDENGKPIFEGKTRERNHYIDGTPRSDAEKAARTPYVSKPKFFGKDKSESEKSKSLDGEKKPYDKKPYGDKKPFDKDKKPYGDKKSFGDKEKKPFDGKKSYSKDDKKPYGDKKPFGDKKPYGDKKPFGDKKPYDKSAKSGKPASDYAKPASSESAAPKRAPRRISVKSLKPSENKE